MKKSVISPLFVQAKTKLSRTNVWLFSGSLALAGIIIFVAVRASGLPLAFELENGLLSVPAKVVTAANASGGSAVQFGPLVTASPQVPPNSGVFTFASLPDTQRDLWNTTSIANNFNGRLNWLVQNKAALNLKYVWQVGDLEDTDNLIFSSDLSVNPRYINSTTFNVDHFQYVQASKGLKILENAGIPYALTVGNHDTGAVCGGPACPVVAGQTVSVPVEVRNTTVFNSFYPPSRFPGIVTMEAGKSDNAYREFQAGGLNWMILNLELWPRTNVIDWAKTVVAAHPHDNVMITTHSYLNSGGSIEQSNGGYGANSPQYMYDNLVKLYPNIRFVFSGHVGNSDYRVDTGVNGNKIYDIMDCYHDTVNNWIRLLTVDTTNNTIKTKVYAPLTNQTRSEAQANLTITNINWVR